LYVNTCKPGCHDFPLFLLGVVFSGEEKLFEYFLIASRSIFETYMMFFGVPFIHPENFSEIA
jgi:hypothetical protein